jgi:subtilisin family serine protease
MSQLGIRWILMGTLMALLLPTSALFPGIPATAQPQGGAWEVPGEVLVAFREGATVEDALRVERRLRPAAARTLGRTRVRRMRLLAGASTAAAIRSVSLDPAVAYAQPNFIYRASGMSNDPMVVNGSLWGLHNTGQYGGRADADVDAPEAWDRGTGSASIAVAIVDTGVDYTHPDLAANIWTNPGEVPGNGVDDDRNGYVDDIHGWDALHNDGDPMDENGHGTHVAGTIGAAGNNGAGIAGINWRVTIIPTRFMDAGGYGSTADAVECLDYLHTLKDRGVNIVAANNSWGGNGEDRALRDAVERSNTRGILFVVAAGNGDSSGNGVDNDRVPNIPANYTSANVISVTAVDRNDARAVWANYGASTVDLGAPGVDIWSTLPRNSYGFASGTSMAAPHVTGAIALLASVEPSLSARQLKERLLSTGDPCADLSGRTLTGCRLNVYNAVSNGAPSVPPPSEPEPPSQPVLEPSITPSRSSYRIGESISLTVYVNVGRTRIGGAAVSIALLSPRGRLYTLRGTTTSSGYCRLRHVTRRTDGGGTYFLRATATKTGHQEGAATSSVRVR